jgi:hypothetical protein
VADDFVGARVLKETMVYSTVLVEPAKLELVVGVSSARERHEETRARDRSTLISLRLVLLGEHPRIDSTEARTIGHFP